MVPTRWTSGDGCTGGWEVAERMGLVLDRTALRTEPVGSGKQPVSRVANR